MLIEPPPDGSGDARGGEGDTARAQAASAGGSGAPASRPKRSGRAPATELERRLLDVRTLTVQTLGCVFAESAPGQLSAGATLLPGAAEAVRQLAAKSDVYLVTQVADDTGEANARKALESAGVIGRGPGAVPPHKALFCSTAVGRTACVRQVDPQLHCDGVGESVTELRRFIPRLVLVAEPDAPSITFGPNVARATSLPAYFGL